MKALIALCFLFATSLGLAQPAPYAPEEGIYWIEGKTVTITYSPNGAPATVPHSQMVQALAQVEARLNGLNIPGLRVAIGNTNLPNACAHKERNVVNVCWELRDGRRADSIMAANTDGTTFWRESTIVLGNQADWTDPTRSLYQQLQHYLLHILGFAHPPRGEGTELSVINNNSSDLTAIDIQGLREMYGTTRCALRYDADGFVYVPFVTYAGRAYTARLQNQGGGSFSIVPGSLSMYSSGKMPLTPCQSLVIDGSNEFHIPQVWIGATLYWATLRLANGRLTMQSSGH